MKVIQHFYLKVNPKLNTLQKIGMRNIFFYPTNFEIFQEVFFIYDDFELGFIFVAVYLFFPKKKKKKKKEK
jgi:hypothetical protein